MKRESFRELYKHLLVKPRKPIYGKHCCSTIGNIENKFCMYCGDEIIRGRK